MTDDDIKRLLDERYYWRNRHDEYVRKAQDWHRRMQQAEAACAAAHENKPRTGGRSLGRALANSAAHHYRTERDALREAARMALAALDAADAESVTKREFEARALMARDALREALGGE